MNKDIRDKWVAALRSGQYEQGTEYLCKRGRYCCLGVLAEILGAFVDGCSCMLSDETLDAIALSLREARTLAEMNDEGFSFADIADYIERWL